MDFRDYDPAIARWTGIDPVTHHNMSPYMAFDGNPVFWADPSGADAIITPDGITFDGNDAKSAFNGLLNFLDGEDSSFDITGMVVDLSDVQSEGGTVGGDGGGASLIYQRTTETDLSTTGSFYIPGTKIRGYILEPAGPSTTKSGLDRRIPAGTYNVIKNIGSKYGLRLYNDQVPQSRAILLHIGNYPGDTEGCLLPGSSIGLNFVGGSGSMINQIMNYFDQTGYAGATITIYDIKAP